jgi:AraC family transcriptional regulator
MTPGSLLLGDIGQCFECGHEHAVGDRCVSFQYDAEYLDRMAVDRAPLRRAARVPPLRAMAALTARACAALGQDSRLSWEELAVALAAQTSRAVLPSRDDTPRGAEARVTRVVRLLDERPASDAGLARLANEAHMSPYHFLRTFERMTGLTPHQYVMRTRLRRAAVRLTNDTARVLDIAIDAGFGDVSNFNRAFRAEFGMNPRAYRRQR